MSDMRAVRIVETIKKCLKVERDKIALHEPCFQGREWDYVKDCLDTAWVSYLGKYVGQFEEMLAEFTGVKHVISVVNGTEAIHISLLLVGVERSDEVLTPDLTFVATANAVAYSGAIPHFVDVEEKTLGIDPIKLNGWLEDIVTPKKDGSYNKLTGRRIKAILPMHTFGHPVDMDPLLEICKKYRIEVVEDATESLGSYYKGRHTGCFGRVGTLSFNGNKIVTTGGGGAILTNEDELAQIASHITKTAKIPHPWAYYHDRVGYNYRLTNINAALGCAQMEQLPAFLEKKRNLAERYRIAFHGIEGVRFFNEPSFAKSNYWLNAILLDDGGFEARDAVLEQAHQEGILARPAWTLMHKLPMYKDCPKMDVTIAEDIEKRLVNLPSSTFL